MPDAVPCSNVVQVNDLDLFLDNTSFVPFYEQIVDRIRTLIKENRLREGQVFCSEGEIARALGISKMPVRHAFQKLRSEGLLLISRGRRPVVGSGLVPWNFQQLRGFSEEMRRRGLDPSAKLLSCELLEPHQEVFKALRLLPGEKIYQIKRLRLVNGEPVAVVTSHLPARIFSGIERYNLESQSLYYVMESVYRRKLHWAEEVIGAVMAGGEESELLQTAVGTSLLHIRETTYDVTKKAIEFSVSLLRGDRYTARLIAIRKG